LRYNHPETPAMPHYNYLIIGGGMTANAAARGIREIDATGSIGIIGAEAHPPYSRPPLSKALWKGTELDSIWLKTEELSPELHLGRQVRELNPRDHQATDDRGAVYTYGKLLLATGGTPRRLPSGGDSVIYYRTVDDYHHLRKLAGGQKRFAVIGGGFIGSEIAAALAMNQCKVTLIFPAEGIGGRMFPADLSKFLNGYYREKGVDVRPGEQVSGVQSRGGETLVRSKDGREWVVDAVVAGLGIQPNMELAQAAGLTVNDGVIVDESLRTSDPDIFAAGDVAEFFNPALDQRLRVEHEDNANTMGKVAGQSMAGSQVRYHHLPLFYSDLFDLGYEAVGELDSRLETFADWKEPHREGVVYYLRDGRVRGVLLWNVWNQVDAARRLIAERGPFEPADLKGRLPQE
jgi:3-phenylpropionate/trans-cinnamate dioxygenase ferredoxin reductase component